MSEEKSGSHRMGVQTVIERLRNQHGQVGAHKLALLEQQKARRARCLKRFHFWGTVVGKSRVDSFETGISCCGARAANHPGTTRAAPRAARRRSSGAGGRWPTAPRQQFPRSTSRSPSRRPEGDSRETVSIPSRIPGLQSGPRPLPALAGLVPEPIMVGGLVGRPARREGRRAQPASPGLRQDVERRPVRHVRRRRCSPRNARPRRDPPALADAKFALNSAVVRGEPQEVLNELRAKVAALEVK